MVPQNPTIWATNWREFIKDSVAIRQDIPGKVKYFQNYNNIIAPRLTTKASAFNIWANLLAAIHPAAGTIIRLNLHPSESHGYDTHYQFVRTEVHILGDCVYHYLEPVNDRRARAIIIFRGTGLDPAIYYENGVQRTEPNGFWADSNLVSVASVAYLYVRRDIGNSLARIAGDGRLVTLIGFSLGGAFAMRALKHHCKHTDFRIWSQTHLFLFSAVGVGFRAARRLRNFFSGPQVAQLHASWHRHDIIAKTGHYPNTVGHVYDEPGPTQLTAMELHTLPFVSIQEVWHDPAFHLPALATRPKYTGIFQFSRNVFRQLGGIPATFYTPIAQIRSRL